MPVKKGAIPTMTKEELIEAACEIIGVDVKDLSVDQNQKLMTITQRLADLGLKESRSFGNLCAIRATIDAAATAGGTTDDLVTVGLTQEQCAFLLALVDQEIREHA
jgi:ferritin-like protein